MRDLISENFDKAADRYDQETDAMIEKYYDDDDENEENEDEEENNGRFKKTKNRNF